MSTSSTTRPYVSLSINNPSEISSMNISRGKPYSIFLLYLTEVNTDWAGTGYGIVSRQTDTIYDFITYGLVYGVWVIRCFRYDSSSNTFSDLKNYQLS